MKLNKFFLIMGICFIVGGAFGLIQEKISPKTHTVTETVIIQEGDTLYDICYNYRKLDCRDPYILEFIDEIKELNPHLKQGKFLQPGDKILVRYKQLD